MFAELTADRAALRRWSVNQGWCTNRCVTTMIEYVITAVTRAADASRGHRPSGGSAASAIVPENCVRVMASRIASAGLLRQNRRGLASTISPAPFVGMADLPGDSPQWDSG